MKTVLMHAKFILVIAALYQVSGCAPVAPRLDGEFGKSFNALKAYQTINPHASANPVNHEMDGHAAKEAVARYYKSFSTPAPQQHAFTIGSGSGGR